MAFTEGTGVMRTYEDGDAVFEQGEPGEHLYIVVEGGVRIRKAGDLVATVVAEFGPGDMFGEQALVENQPHSASAEAVGHTEIALYDKETFLAALRDDPELALRVIQSLSSRLRSTTEQLQRVCTQYVLDRTEMALTQKAILENELT